MKNNNNNDNNSFKQTFLQGIHPGFNYFHQIPFPKYHQNNHFYSRVHTKHTSKNNTNINNIQINNSPSKINIKRLRVKTLTSQRIDTNNNIYVNKKSESLRLSQNLKTKRAQTQISIAKSAEKQSKTIGSTTNNNTNNNSALSNYFQKTKYNNKTTTNAYSRTKNYHSFHNTNNSPSHSLDKEIYQNFNIHNATNNQYRQSEMAYTLRQNRFKLEKLKTQVDYMRQQQFSQYIKQSIRYQGLLQINDNKKKRLPTLNAKIGQIVKKSATELNLKHVVYDAEFTKIKLQGWKPESRQGHTCVQYGKDNVIMIGGHCSHPFSKANIYSFQKNGWIKTIQTNTARSYHTSVLYKSNYIITFGGMGVYNASRKCRQCFNTISLIDLKNQSSKVIKMTNQQSVQPRRSHSASLMGKYMMIFGGMNTKKEYLNDLVYLDIKDLRWSHKQFKIQGKDLQIFLNSGLAKHQSYTYFAKVRKSYPMYHAQYTDQQGIYFFGGANQEGQSNVIMQLAFNRYVPILKRVQYTGKAPSSIDPIVEKYNDNCVIIISGDQYERQLTVYNFRDHKFTSALLNMKNTLVQSQKPLLGGLGSTLIYFKSNYYVFFGLGKQGYIGSIGSFYINEKLQDNQDPKTKKQKVQNDWRNFLAVMGNNNQDSWAQETQSKDIQL